MAGRRRVPQAGEGVLFQGPPLQDYLLFAASKDPTMKGLVPISLEVDGGAGSGASGRLTPRVKNL
jgi:hypothetical protein